MRPIYMDNAATTSVDPRVVAAMLPVFSESYGNDASRNHAFGWEAEELVEIARREVASVLGCEARELVFTSGATESDNLALKGVLRAYSSKGRHLITTKVEHPAVLDAATALERDGTDVTRLRVDSEGRVAPEDVAGAIREDTVLVSIIHGNNETGVVQDVPSIASVCRERGVLLHTDATQSFGKIPTDVRALGCDLLSLSGHMIHGPKGVGALFIRRRNPRVRIEPILDGGGHEGGVRSGTANVPGIVGLGVAARLASKELESDPHRIATLLERLERGIRERPGWSALEHSGVRAVAPYPQLQRDRCRGRGPPPRDAQRGRFQRECLCLGEPRALPRPPGSRTQPGGSSRCSSLQPREVQYGGRGRPRDR